ncbi:hypothetical protein PLICRDRAFT_699818 [Plicaturopsis crispa FD-325 SS-3]|nr:hypothetical protein PLICRDRAFT_699818 [Plicaturopsis crispa FD-325 SS-3]
MQSDASSSSLKRSNSEGPSNDPNGVRNTQGNTDLPIPSNHDIDMYMAEQGEPSGLGTMTPPQKHAHIQQLKSAPMKVGETWYIVSRAWYRRWAKACTGEVDKEGAVDESSIGPVDNSALVDAGGQFISTALEGVDVEFVPREAWDAFMHWYGPPIHPLSRRVIARGVTQEPSLELHPPRVKALRLVKSTSDDVAGAPHPWATVSSTESISTLSSVLASAIKASSDAPFRVWKVESEDFSGSEYPTSKLRKPHAELLEGTQTVQEALIEPGDAFVVEVQVNDAWLVDATTLAQQALEPPPLFNANENFFDRYSASSATTSSVVAAPKQPSTILKPPFSSAMTTRSKTSNREPGTLGLGNLGNTCFMNSALQCLAHTKELAEYFLSGVYEDELNPDNPLGMHGAIAEAFGALLTRIWTASGSTSYSPREFKQALQRFAPQFSGYQQHDSQELVAFLLDGLHEDLNRVHKKPYVENPDWEGGGEKELVKLAQTTWEGYLRRNDSVIVDLFQGQYQSRLVCPECQKVSITFDPFMYLTLPLPIKKKWRHSIIYVPWDIQKPHVMIPVEIESDASFKDLRHLLGRWMGVNPDNLLTLEIFSGRFYKNLNDTVICGEMADNDRIVCYELPCHAQQSRTYKKSDDDPFVLPMFLVDTEIQTRYSYNRGPNPFGTPSVVVITREESTSEQRIYAAVVERLERWTTLARDLYKWEAVASDTVPIQITSLPPPESIAEIQENGEVVTVHETIPEEDDITDAKSLLVQEDDVSMDTSSDDTHELRKVGPKPDLFDLRIQSGYHDIGTGFSSNSSTKFESWKDRREDGNPQLLREGDALFCEFDANIKDYYFGGHSRFDTSERFTHPEYEAAMKDAQEKNTNGITLQDCLDEFTKEEQLGEDDLWYCPRCKKHQQATKKFDLWKAPDILVVHLKRFSNSRALRDKIDVFVDFPVEGLNLEDMVGERKVAKELLAQGIDAEELHLGDLEEPLVYDLFGVDEHLGGLGGGHYRAYALNHRTDKWYHFDDSYVTESRSQDAVNANAYLLFYRRRTTRPMGGKSHDRVEEARLKAKTAEPSAGLDFATNDAQLPTPPNEPSSSYLGTGMSRLSALSSTRISTGPLPDSVSVGLPLSPLSPSPPLLVDELPSFENSFNDQSIDPLQISSQRYDFPDPSSSSSLASPSSSVEAEADLEEGPWQEFGENNKRADRSGAHGFTELWKIRQDDMPAYQENETYKGSPDWAQTEGEAKPASQPTLPVLVHFVITILYYSCQDCTCVYGRSRSQVSV